MKRYEELELLVERTGRRYRARVLRSPVGDASADFAPPFSREELESLTPLLTGALRDVEPRDARPAQRLLQDAGTDLFRAVFRGQVLTCLGRSRDLAAERREGLRLRLRLTRPEMALWPWEYLYDPERHGWLALVPDLSIVRYPEVGEVTPPLQITAPLRVLVVTAGRTGGRPLNVEREWAQIESGLGKMCRRGRVVLERLENGTLSEMQERLGSARYHVLHFIGHGSSGPDGGALVFEGSHGGPHRVSGRALGPLLLSHPTLRLVVLNACEGAREGEEEVFSSVAETLTRNKIPAVVAMRAAVSDHAATSFARHFYRRLAVGDPLEEVITRTRRGMLADEHPVEWGTPVLYLRAASGWIFQMTRPPWYRYAAAAALVLLLVLGLWLAPVFSSKKRAPQEPVPDRSTILANTKTDPRCPMPPGIHIPFKLIEPEPDDNGVKLRPFCMGAFEVTQEQWEKVMGDHHKSAHPGPDRPVDKISLEQAREFARRLSRKDPGGGYRSPLDAEWSYASPEAPYESDIKLLPEYGNCLLGDAAKRTAIVGQFHPNELGLYDMLGNVWEWVEDSPHPETGMGLQRGGAWSSPSRECRSVAKREQRTNSNWQDTGFRIVRDPLPESPQ